MKTSKIRAFKTSLEQTIPEQSQIIGSLPQWLNGSYIRNGPAKWDFPKFQMNHIFDGYALVSKFEIRGGESQSISYASKFLDSEAFKKAEVAQKPVIAEFGTRSAASDSKKSVFARMISSLVPEQSDNCLYINHTPLSPHPMVLGDAGFMFEICKTTLKTLSRYDPLKELGLHALTSHPLVDPITGSIYNVGMTLTSAGAKWHVLRFQKRSVLNESLKGVDIITTFPYRNKTSIPTLHSFGLSTNYIIIIDQPSYYNATKAIGGIFSKGVCPDDLHEWKHEQKCRFYLVHKSTGKLMKTEILSKDAFFFLHFNSCFEQDGHLIVDLFCSPSPKITKCLTLQNMRGFQEGHSCKLEHTEFFTLQRFVIPLVDLENCSQNANLVKIKSTAATATPFVGKLILVPELLCEKTLEASTCNSKYTGISRQPHRYLWSSTSFFTGLCQQQNTLIKFDIITRKIQTWKAKENSIIGDPLFIQNPNATEEDDGVVLLVVSNYFDVKEEKDYIVILDAQSVKELGRSYFNSNLPIAVHGIFLPS